jgi:hypothetical protein
VTDTSIPSHSRLARLALLLESYLKLSLFVGIRGTILVTTVFLLYLGIAISAILFGWPELSYPILSLESDPFFVSSGALVGLFFVQTSGSLVLYHLLMGVEDDKSQFTVLWGFISLGFGGALLRVTLPPVIQLLPIVI